MSTNEKPNAGASGQKAPWTVKRIAAVAGIVLLVAMYVVTLISALIGTPGAGKLFRFSLGMTIAVPIFLWIFIWCVGKLTDQGSMASGRRWRRPCRKRCRRRTKALARTETGADQN